MGEIFTYDSTESLAECHYSRSFLDRLEEMEQQGVSPQSSVLEEVSTGSAANAFGLMGGILGYSRRVYVPSALDPVRLQLINEAMQFGQNDEVTGEVVTADGFLDGTIKAFRERVLSKAGIVRLKAKETALPNHSMVPTTVESCRKIARDAVRQLAGEQVDAIVLAAGNGTSAIGFHDVFREAFPNCELHVFEGACDPDVYQRLHGNLPADVHEDRVTLFGADGNAHLPVKFPEIETLLSEGRVTKERSWLAREPDWRQWFERNNFMKRRFRTFGRSSAAAIGIAHELIERGRDKTNVLTVRYDLADRYGNTLVTSDDATYLDYDRWSDGIRLSKS